MHRFAFVLLGMPALLAAGCGASGSIPASVGSSAVKTARTMTPGSVTAAPARPVTATTSSLAAPTGDSGGTVTTAPPGVLASLIPTKYPLAASPLTFYHPSQYAPRFGIMTQAGGKNVILGLYSGVQDTLLAVAVGRHVVLTKSMFGALSLVALHGNSAVLHVTSAFSWAHDWLVVNLATGSTTTGPSLAALGFSSLDTETGKVLGVGASIPVPTASPQVVAPTSNPPSGLEGTLLYEANRLFATSVSGSAVNMRQTATNRIALMNARPGNWRSVTFNYQAPHWVPTSVTTDGNGQALDYHIQYQNGAPYSGILSNVGLFTYPVTLAHGSASIWTSQLGALAQLPIDLDRFVPVPQTLGNPKIALKNGSTSVLALTYEAKSNKGQNFYAPTGWYWWTGAPNIYPANTPPAPSPPASSS